MFKLTELEHTADRAFRVRGDDLRELFANAAGALFRLQRQRAGKTSGIIRQVEVEGFDRETLLVNWLNEILYSQEVHKETFARVEIQEISDKHLKARLYGQKGRRVQRLIKAVTFHGLKVLETKRGLEADIIVDV
jgi:SHS2 domain-containing protein